MSSNPSSRGSSSREPIEDRLYEAIHRRKKGVAFNLSVGDVKYKATLVHKDHHRVQDTQAQERNTATKEAGGSDEEHKQSQPSREQA